MQIVTLIVNGAPYGTEGPYNAFRLAGALLASGAKVNIFLMSDGVLAVKARSSKWKGGTAIMGGQMMGLGTGLGMLLWAVAWAGITFFVVYEAVYLATRRAFHEIWGQRQWPPAPTATGASEQPQAFRSVHPKDTLPATPHRGVMLWEFVGDNPRNWLPYGYRVYHVMADMGNAVRDQ